MTLKNNSIKLERAKFWTDKEILFCKMLNMDASHHLTDETADTYLKAIVTLCNGKKMPLLIDLRNTQGAFLSTAAKKLGEGIEISKLILSEAFVINSLNVKLLINSFKRIYEPITPFEIFEDYNDALNYSINSKNSNNGSK